MNKRHYMTVGLVVVLGSGHVAAAVDDLDVDAEKAAIREAVEGQQSATNVGGAEGARGYASFATDDTVWLPPDAPPIRGRDAVEEWVAEITSRPGHHVDLEPELVFVARSGDLAYSVGRYVSTMDDEPTVIGKFVDIWRKQPDGSWKIAVASFSPNAPAGQAQPVTHTP